MGVHQPHKKGSVKLLWRGEGEESLRLQRKKGEAERERETYACII